MKRGDLWIGSATADFAKKPRPHLIVQANQFLSADSESVVICPLTSFIQPQIRYRVILEPTLDNGLEQTSQLMIDKITHVNSQKLTKNIGHLAESDMVLVNHLLMGFLGLGTHG